jgi:hypothetical protein
VVCGWIKINLRKASGVDCEATDIVTDCFVLAAVPQADSIVSVRTRDAVVPGTVRTLWVIPRIGTRTAELLETPIMLVVACGN